MSIWEPALVTPKSPLCLPFLLFGGSEPMNSPGQAASLRLPCPLVPSFQPLLMATRGLHRVHSLPLFPSGETCLHQAAALGQRTICHYIVEAGASLMKTDQQVSPPSHMWGAWAALATQYRP